jgi:2-octaprenyl-6-methoxyphenol hydroxylase
MMAARVRTQCETQVDVLIVGGGFVGNTLAAALAGTGVSSAMVDTADLREAIDAEFDGRSFAVSLSNQRLLAGVGVWESLVERTAPILDIRISDNRSLMFLHYDHRETGDDPMGFMVENHHLRRAQYERLQAADDVRVFAPDRVERLIRNQHGVSAELGSGGKVWARLVVGADGRSSMVRADAGIATTKWTYDQSGIVCTVRHERHHNHIAHERFLPAGPFAILPLQGDPLGAGNRSSLVWTERNDLTPIIMGLDDPSFLAEVRLRFGDFLGEVELAGPRYVFPLSLQFAQRLMEQRLVLAGDAAHAMHPIAGQGLNMGLRDVAALAEVLVDAARLGQDVGDQQVLARYVRWRRFDNTLMLAATDGLNRLFSNDVGPLRLARDLGLAAINRLPPVKRFFMRHAMGLVGDLPRLLRGERLI